MFLATLSETRLHGMHIIGSSSGEANRALLVLAARMAIHEPIRVIDAGCSLDVHRVAREIRRQSAHLHESLDNIRLSRAFGCWQTGEAIHALPVGSEPLLVFDLPTPFYDESVSFNERMRLLERCALRLREHAAGIPVIISARPSINAPDQAILESLLRMADEVHLIDQGAAAAPQMALF